MKLKNQFPTNKVLYYESHKGITIRDYRQVHLNTLRCRCRHSGKSS